MLRWKKESVAELHRRKTMEQLQKENEELKKQLEAQGQQIDDTMLALCDVFEMVLGGDV